MKAAEPFVCGGSAATFASIVIHPIDLAKVSLNAVIRLRNRELLCLLLENFNWQYFVFPISPMEKILLKFFPSFFIIQVRMQLFGQLNPGKPIPSFPTIISNIVKSDGVSGIYKGVDAAIGRQMVYGTARIGLHRSFSDILVRRNEGKPINFLAKTLSGMASGSIAVCIGTPFDIALVRLQSDSMAPAAERRNYKNVFDVSKTHLLSQKDLFFLKNSRRFSHLSHFLKLSYVIHIYVHDIYIIFSLWYCNMFEHMPIYLCTKLLSLFDCK